MLAITKTAGGAPYGNPIVGQPLGMTQIKLDVSTLSTNEVDANGYLKPGVPLKVNGALVSGTTQVIYGITVEAQKILTGNTTLGSETFDPLVTVCTIGLVNFDVVEDNLGRALSANEIAAFAAAGCHLQTTTT
jgi:hypothetical protein